MTISALRWRQISLATRVTILVGLTFVSCVVVLGLIVQRSISQHFIEQDADELRVVADSVQHALQESSERLAEDNVEGRLEHAVSGHHGVFYAVYDREGSVFYASPGPDLSSLAYTISPVEKITTENLHQWTEDSKTYRGTVLNADDSISAKFGGNKIVVASSMDFHKQFMDRFYKVLWGILGCASVVILLSAWFAVRFAHRPLHRISQKIGDITTEKLNLRLDADNVPVDLLELTTSFNEMIGRMEEVFQRLSNFSADIAHELRTPITNLTTQTQVALSKGRDSEEYVEILYSNLEEYERMASMINDMLWLAQSDNGMLRPAFEGLDLRVEISELFDYLGAWAEDRDVSFSLEGACPLIEGDKSMLRRALTNLLTNAVHHSDPGAAVSVHLSSDSDDVGIAIANEGNDIPVEHLPRIFDRFYRVDPSRQRAKSAGRSGLGLAIVSSIVAIHRGEISVTSQNGKTIFHISLSRSAHTAN
jgi:two-component system, OmpR family, heavy metal sensor histidine kinase CusS